MALVPITDIEPSRGEMMAEVESGIQDATDPALGLSLTASSLRLPRLPSVRQGLSPASSPTSESPRKEAVSHSPLPSPGLTWGCVSAPLCHVSSSLVTQHEVLLHPSAASQEDLV